MRDFKYITFRSQGKEHVMLFPKLVTHKYIWAAVRRTARYNPDMADAECVSAGFYCLNTKGTVTAYGRSDTLDLDSREEDEPLIAEMLQGGPPIEWVKA
jgi:hypothetical protein